MPKLTNVILLVEDEDSVRALLRLFLGRKQFHVIEAKTGLEGLGLARSMHPDIIITDLMMPGMSGVELITELKKDVATQLIPIICITGASYEHQKAASAAGAAAVISKPLHIKEFVALVTSLLP